MNEMYSNREDYRDNYRDDYRDDYMDYRRNYRDDYRDYRDYRNYRDYDRRGGRRNYRNYREDDYYGELEMIMEDMREDSRKLEDISEMAHNQQDKTMLIKLAEKEKENYKYIKQMMEK